MATNLQVPDTIRQPSFGNFGQLGVAPNVARQLQRQAGEALTAFGTRTLGVLHRAQASAEATHAMSVAKNLLDEFEQGLETDPNFNNFRGRLEEELPNIYAQARDGVTLGSAANAFNRFWEQEQVNRRNSVAITEQKKTAQWVAGVTEEDLASAIRRRDRNAVMSITGSAAAIGAMLPEEAMRKRVAALQIIQYEDEMDRVLGIAGTHERAVQMINNNEIEIRGLDPDQEDAFKAELRDERDARKADRDFTLERRQLARRTQMFQSYLRLIRAGRGADGAMTLADLELSGRFGDASDEDKRHYRALLTRKEDIKSVPDTMTGLLNRWYQLDGQVRSNDSIQTYIYQEHMAGRMSLSDAEKWLGKLDKRDADGVIKRAMALLEGTYRSVINSEIQSGKSADHPKVVQLNTQWQTNALKLENALNLDVTNEAQAFAMAIGMLAEDSFLFGLGRIPEESMAGFQARLQAQLEAGEEVDTRAPGFIDETIRFLEERAAAGGPNATIWQQMAGSLANVGRTLFRGEGLRTEVPEGGEPPPAPVIAAPSTEEEFLRQGTGLLSVDRSGPYPMRTRRTPNGQIREELWRNGQLYWKAPDGKWYLSE